MMTLCVWRYFLNEMYSLQSFAYHPSAMIRTLEELAANAWPSLQTMLYDGWVLRFAEGYTRRANSVHPLYPGGLDVDGKIAACERLYQSWGLTVVFKMTPAAQPEHLDDLLAARGYTVDARTSVQVLDLNGLDKAPVPTTQLAESLSDEWLDAFGRMSRLNDERKAIARRLLSNLLLTFRCASIRHQDQIAACGLGVCQDRHVGLYDIVVDENLRRQGLGKRLVLDLLAWAKRGGAQTAYLQVMSNNEPALRLYAGLGFREAYQYWYRVKGL
jgi:GNAT superfamily N-acetyltransferase